MKSEKRNSFEGEGHCRCNGLAERVLLFVETYVNND